MISKLTKCGGINCTTGKVYTGACISLGGITNTVSLLWKYLLMPPILWECRLSLGRVWSAACTPTVPDSHEGLFYRAWVMTGWYTEPCLIRNPSGTRIMSSYLHDCQGTVKNSVRGCSVMTSYCLDSQAARQLLSSPCCGLALEHLYISWTGPLALSISYFFILF